MSWHTPGPWTQSLEFIHGQQDVHVCTLNDMNHYAQSNAFLITAAPDLLMACTSCLAAFDVLKALGADKHLPGFERCLANLKSAIAKAEGGAA